MAKPEFSTQFAERINGVLAHAASQAPPPAGSELSNRQMLGLGVVLLVLAVYVPISCVREWNRPRPRPHEHEEREQMDGENLRQRRVNAAT